MNRRISILGALLLMAFGINNVEAQRRALTETCKIGHQAAAIGFWTWPAKTQVQVYIRSADFKADQLPLLLTALQNWNLTSEETGSGVKFEYRGDTARERSCAGCLTIMRGRVFDKKTRHATELRAFSANSDQLITSAVVLIDPVLTNPRAILNALVHELGHNLGLLDCYTCQRRSTVMNQFAALNVPNEMERPTPCDVAQVQRVYAELKTLVRASPLGRDVLPVDEGEEPVDDDTPIVIPAPAQIPAGSQILSGSTRPPK